MTLFFYEWFGTAGKEDDAIKINSKGFYRMAVIINKIFFPPPPSSFGRSRRHRELSFGSILVPSRSFRGKDGAGYINGKCPMLLNNFHKLMRELWDVL